ncbi:MAG: hypothetical protein AAGB10_12595 [Pseudomonadota bacterium]
MKRVLIAVLLLALPDLALADVRFGQSQGRFPVFGPSAEREGFFADQAARRAAEAAEFRRAAQERRLQRLRLREAEARADEARARADVARLRDRCRPVLTEADRIVEPGGTRRGARYCWDGTRLWPLVRPVPRSSTSLRIEVDRSGVSGTLDIRRPGLQLGVVRD